MYNEQEIEYLRAQLINHFDNHVACLTRSTGLSRPTINKFLRSEHVKPSNQDLIYKTGLELITKKKKEREELVNSLKSLTTDHEFSETLTQS